MIPFIVGELKDYSAPQTLLLGHSTAIDRESNALLHSTLQAHTDTRRTQHAHNVAGAFGVPGTQRYML